MKLTVIARSNYDAVSAKGIRIISDNHGEHIVRPYKGSYPPLFVSLGYANT